MDDTNQNPTDPVRHLNDLLRRTGSGGRTVITAGVAALADDLRMQALEAIAAFDGFTDRNDPYGEHDCAIVAVGTLQLLWKIDYFDLELQCASPDPADPAVTCRVLTIMLAEEY